MHQAYVRTAPDGTGRNGSETVTSRPLEAGLLLRTEELSWNYPDHTPSLSPGFAKTRALPSGGEL